MNSTLRYGLAAFCFGAIVFSIIAMPFGDRGYHFVAEADAEVGPTTAGEGDGYDLSKLNLLTRSVGYVRSYYVEPERFEPREMLVSAVEAVQDMTPPLLAKVIRAADGAATELAVTVYGETKSFSLDQVDDLFKMNWKLLDVFAFIEGQLRQQESSSDIEYAAIAGLLETLDPHSIMLTPEVYREMKLGTSGEFGGLGIVISTRAGKLTVVSVIEDTPAFEARLKSGDVIVQVGEESTINMSLTEAVNRLRGAAGTAVTIWVLRDGWEEPRAFTIKRANITIRAAEGHALGREVGYVRIKHFQQNTFRELESELRRLRASGHWRGLIIDLRDNPGGLLDAAVKVSDAFLDDGTIVSTVGAGNQVREEKRASAGGTYADIPIVVLVNAGSASASEIVAGALKNNGRALVIGDRTFGKGSVQALYDIDDAALKLTIAQYLTPGESSIQSVGIVPDVQTIPVDLDPDAVDLYLTDRDFRVEADLPKHLVHGSARDGERADIVVRYLEAERPDDNEGGFFKDKTVAFAERLLTVVDSAERDVMLKAAGRLFAELNREEDARIRQELRSLGVDWRKRPRGAAKETEKPEIRVELLPDTSSVEAGGTVNFKARVSNDGAEPVYRVHGITRSNYRRFDDLEFVFGVLRPGETREWSVPRKVSKSALTRWAPVRMELFSEGRPLRAAAETSVSVEARPEPRFVFRIRFDDSSGNGDGRIQRGERFKLHLEIRNEGPGGVKKGVATLGNGGKQGVFVHAGRFEFGELAVSDDSASVDFDVELKSDFADERVRLEIRVFDSALRHYVQYDLDIPVDRALSLDEGLRAAPAIGELPDAPMSTHTDDGEVAFSADVLFPEAAPSERRLIYAYLGDEKIFFEEHDESGASAVHVPISFRVPLEHGENRISVFAKLGEQPATRKSFYIYRTGQPMEAVGEVR